MTTSQINNLIVISFFEYVEAQQLNIGCVDPVILSPVYSNRAMVQLHFENFGHAISDSLQAIKYD